MIIDGRRIAEEIGNDSRKRIEALGRAPVLSIITCNPNFETQKYLALKEKKATAIGIDIKIFELDDTHTTKDFLLAIQEASSFSDGVIVQLPLRETIDTEMVLRSIPESLDVDALNPHTTTLLSPVVGAVKEILESAHLVVAEKQVTVIGSGRLVGVPVAKWCRQEGAHVMSVTKETKDIATHTKNADIIICGAGVPGLVTPEMVREGVVILDAGTSEDGGVLRGDADPLCGEKASLFTPVPGGIGPVTIAILLRNVVDCATRA